MNPILVLQSMRPRQWTKNLVLFAAIIFSLKMAQTDLLLRTALGFAVFFLLSGVVYLMNDLKDRHLDAQHPLKKDRPIASGNLTPAGAFGAITGLLVLGLAAAVWLGPSFVWVSLGYLALNVLYSFLLRNQVILDVMAISTGFVLRAIAGARILHEAGDPV